ncbi:MAG: methylaspartate mutase [Proteobacteria bacterium]|nr:methylaspartate mutase [Pseudomonadota bacterium]
MGFSHLNGAQGALWLQPRMGVPQLGSMRAGVAGVKDLPFSTIGTITIDNFTRLDQVDEARKALMRGDFLSGFPLLCYDPDVIKEHILRLTDATFPIQVRHGTPRPQALFTHMLKCGLTLTEGGPVSYCLPYSAATRLIDAVRAWEEGCHTLSAHKDAHIESFGGCLMGQMCHPSLLVAVGILEALFFQTCGLRSLSLSYAQQYSLVQDLAALKVLARLAKEYLAPHTSWHTVVYTFMGLFPLTSRGHAHLLKDSVWLARHGGAKRLIVKTDQEACGLPTITSNIDALTLANTFAQSALPPLQEDHQEEESIYTQAKILIDETLTLSENIGRALELAFKKGIIDIPFCMHPDNLRQAFCDIDACGYLQWKATGNMPITACKEEIKTANFNKITAKSFLEMLAFNRTRYDTL